MSRLRLRALPLLALPLLVLLAGATPAGAAPLPAGTTAVLSGTSDLLGVLPRPVDDTGMGNQAVSQDGKRIVFSSTSDGLSPVDDDDVSNVYVRDLTTGTTELVSRGIGEDGAISHANCGDPAISDNGRRVAFTCDGALDPADTNEHNDVYLRDLVTKSTGLVSRRSGFGPVGNSSSYGPVLDETGANIAFASKATNLAPGTDQSLDRIYRRTLGAADETLLVSRKDGIAGAPTDAFSPTISDDGQRITFTTYAAVDPADTNNTDDVYVRIVSTATTQLVSRASGAAGAPGNGRSTDGHISGNGEFVAFTSRATNLGVGDATDDDDVFQRSLSGQTNAVLTVAASGRAVGIDDSGSDVAYISPTTTTDPNDTQPGDDVYLRVGDAVTLVSRGDAPGSAANTAWDASVSGDGRTVAMLLGSGLTPDAEPALPSVVARDLAAQRTHSVSRPSGTAPFLNDGGAGYGGSVSADGRYVAFTSDARALGVPAGTQAVLVRDTVTGAITFASREDGASGPPMPGIAAGPVISADGRHVAFSVSSPEPGAGLAPRPLLVYVRDLAAGTTRLVSRADGPDGAQPNGGSYQPSISADGRRVAFVSLATNLGAGDADDDTDVFVRDLTTGRTVLVSRATGAAGAPANGPAAEGIISADGRRVAFATYATNLGDGDADEKRDVHLRDLETGVTELVSKRTDDTKGSGSSGDPSISADGQRVTFVSRAQNLGPATNTPQAYVRDLSLRTLTRASLPDGVADGTVAPATEAATISPDGSRVAFVASSATPLAPGHVSGGGLFLRTLATQTTALVSRRTGADGAPISPSPVRPLAIGGLTTDGACITFATAARVLDPPVSADVTQVYLRALAADCGRPAGPGPGDGGDDGDDGAGGDGGGDILKPGDGGPRSGVDRVAPRLTSVRLSRTRFRVGAGRTALTAATGRGTVLSLRLSEAARLTVTVERERPGRKRGSRCRVVSKRPSRGACTAYTRDGTLKRALRAGTSRIAFSGRLGSRKLALGRHRLTIRATDAAGNVSRTVRLRLTIVRR